MNPKDEMIEITLDGGKKIEVNKMIWYFIELLKIHDDAIPDITTIINEFSSFLDYWDDFRMSKKDATYENKHLQRFNLFHTIKPKTEYAHQQDFKEGKALLYPVYRISNGTVYSMACGGNYPLEDCIIYTRDGKTIEIIKK